jgi:branched-chain amino acid transport system substrate-binding protein
MFEAIEPGKADYWDVVQKMQAKGIEVLYFGGYQHEAALIVRQAREHGHKLHLVAGDGINQEDFGLIADPASDGTLMSNAPQPVNPEARALLERLTPDVGAGADLKPYAAVQVWVEAVEKAGTFETEAVAEAYEGMSSIPSSATLASMRRATSPATRRSSGTSGRMANTRRSNPAS